MPADITPVDKMPVEIAWFDKMPACFGQGGTKNAGLLKSIKFHKPVHVLLTVVQLLHT